MSQVPEVRVDQYLGKSPLPEIDEEGVALAKRLAGKKVAYFDAHYPDEATDDIRTLQGFRVVGADGAFTGEEWVNPGFVPHRETAGTEFHSDFELELWRTVNGYVPLGQFVRALATADLMAMVNDRGELEIQPNEHGDATLDVCTSLRRVPSTWPRSTSLRGKDLLEHLGRSRSHLGIHFNRTSRPRLRMPAQTMTALWLAVNARIDDRMRTGPLPTAPTPMGTVTAGGQQ
jgi:hypothetical protein